MLRPANLGFSKSEQQIRYQWSKDEDLQYWSGNIPSARTFEEFQRMLPERDWPADGRRRSYAILDLSYCLIGMVSCYAIDSTLRTGELGVYIGDRNRWGHGSGTDAVATMLRHLFYDVEFRQVSLNTYASNTRAIRSYAKVGFERLGTRKRFRPSMGYYREVRMAIDRDRFAARFPPSPASQIASGASRQAAEGILTPTIAPPIRRVAAKKG